jgi:energy-coupling factor transporter ATP-binding protein EcfA2
MSKREAQHRLGAVLDFAELGDFLDLKLKNYSSGMMVRLAFSVMIHAPETDILLIDEVLAVGDASFQQKCADVFRKMRDRGRTIVLVTHDMGAVETYCERAMAIDLGVVQEIGDPVDVARAYLRLNFEGPDAGPYAAAGVVPGMHVELLDTWLEDSSGQRVANTEAGEPLRLNVALRARDDWLDPVLGFHCYTADNVHVFSFHHTVGDGEGTRVRSGERVTVTATADGRLMPGAYQLRCWIASDRVDRSRALRAFTLLDFVVYGPELGRGLVSLDVDADAVVERDR